MSKERNQNEKQRVLKILKKETRVKDEMNKLKLRQESIKKEEELIEKQRAQIDKNLKKLQFKEHNLHEKQKQLDIQKRENDKQKDVNAAKRKMLEDSDNLVIMKYLAYNRMSSKSPAEKPEPTKKRRMVNADSQTLKFPGISVEVQTEPFTSTTIVHRIVNSPTEVQRIYICFFCCAEFSRPERVFRHCHYVHRGRCIKF